MGNQTEKIEAAVKDNDELIKSLKSTLEELKIKRKHIIKKTESIDNDIFLTKLSLDKAMEAKKVITEQSRGMERSSEWDDD